MSKKEKVEMLASDALLKKCMENKDISRQFLSRHLPVNIKELLDLQTILISKESFVDDDLRRNLSDIIFTVDTKDKQQAFVTVLVEHQSKPDYWMAFRLWKYLISFCDRYRNDQEEKLKTDKIKNKIKKQKDIKLPLIVPIVFYQGTTKYNVALNLWELFANPELAKKTLSEDYTLVDLQKINDQELGKQQQLFEAMCFIMKNIHKGNILQVIDQFFSLFAPTISEEQESDYIYIKLLLLYTMPKIEKEERKKIDSIIEKHLPSKSEDIMGNLAQHYYDEGKAEGKAEGERESQLKIMKNMLGQGLDITLIAKITNLSKKEILHLQKNLGQQN